MKKLISNSLINNNPIRTLLRYITTAAVVSLVSPSVASDNENNATKILEANFDPINVVQVEVGDFHFKPGQIAPVHTHTAPAIGYIMKGEIIFQVEGEKQLILHEGDAFYEPAGPRILRFDNASATEEAIFIDFNLEQEGESFIVFEKPPTEAIDRRTLPTTPLGGKPVRKVDVSRTYIDPGKSTMFNSGKPIFGVVAEGVVVIHNPDGTQQRVVTGTTFAISNARSATAINNASNEAPAKLIAFRIL